jgi:hypothetical protein
VRHRRLELHSMNRIAQMRRGLENLVCCISHGHFA